MPNARTRLAPYSPEVRRMQEEQAFIMFAQRKTLNEIGDALGITPQTARTRVAQGIKLVHAEERTAAVKKDLRLIDVAIKRLVDLLDHHDPDVAIKASNALMNALKRRSMLLGLDAPQNIVVAGQVEVIAKIDPRIAEARELLKVEATRMPEGPPDAEQPALPAAES